MRYDYHNSIFQEVTFRKIDLETGKSPGKSQQTWEFSFLLPSNRLLNLPEKLADSDQWLLRSTIYNCEIEI